MSVILKNVVVGSALTRETWKHFQVLQTEAVSIVGLFIVFAYRISHRTVLKKKKSVSTIHPARRCDFCPSQVKFNLIFFFFKFMPSIYNKVQKCNAKERKNYTRLVLKCNVKSAIFND